MKTSYIALLLAAASFAPAASIADEAKPGETPAKTAPAANAPAAANSAEPVIKKGMPAEKIRELIGTPQEIEPVKNSELKAEKWIYRREISHTIKQSASGQTSVPAMITVDTSGGGMGSATVPSYRLTYVTLYQVTSLLMVDGKLVVGKQWKEQSEKFAD